MPGGPTGRRLLAVPEPITVDVDPLDDYDPRYLICRGEAHAWPFDDPKQSHWNEEHEEGRVVGHRRVMMCPRCKAIATDKIDRYGKFTRNTLLPEGYRISRQTHGFIPKGRIRLASINRQRPSAVTA